MKFKERLNQLVEESELSPADIAAGMGITLRGLEYLLKGRSNPRVYVLCAAADYFRISTDYLLGRTEERR